MAGKSSKGRNRRVSCNSANSTVPVETSNPVKGALPASEASKYNDNGVASGGEANDANPDLKGSAAANAASEATQGELHLYPVSVKTQNGEKLELQLNPGDAVLDIRQFLLDAPETCFFTCYDLLLNAKDGSTHQLEDHNEISEVEDITVGGCSLEMVAAPYDDRSIRAHVHRTRELLSLSTYHSSLSKALALEYEKSQNKSAVSGDPKRVEVPEIDRMGFLEDVTGSLNKFFLAPTKEITCVDSMVFSSFNPPPSYRRLVGDLIYSDVVTLEGSKHCITGTTKMFYVNSSTGNILDPRPSKPTYEATTLVGLLQKISPKFKKAFQEILERKASMHPFENVQSLLPPNSWLGSYPIPEHIRDAARAEEALTLSYGSELIGMQRDWNEELQSCREFPHATPQERILRDRALYKVTSDFVEAAICGAIGVVNRCIPPINPTDPECFHMYVHNNIFFSFAVDADLDQLSGKCTSTTNLKTSSSVPDLLETDSSDALQVEHANAKGGASDVPKLAGESGSVESSPSPPSATTQLAESEQATYASANNDLKGTKAYQEADVSGLYNLAMAIIDYRGHRVVAQSVLPGILQGDKSDSILYGSVDNGKKINWNEDFHSKVLEAAKRLHTKEHTILDSSGNVYKLAAPVECKGIIGSDDRHYLLDLMRVTPRDANYTGPGSRFCVLRSELIAAFCQAEAVKKSKSKAKAGGEAHNFSHSAEASGADKPDKAEANASRAPGDGPITGSVEDGASAPAEHMEVDDEIFFNTNVFTEFKLAGSPEEIASDEENVRKASSYLADTVLPKFIQDLCSLEVSPMDGQTLTEALHAYGINVRYIGKVAVGTRHLPHLWDLCSNEIAVRAAKHILKDVLRETENHDLSPAISHFFNCFFGSCQSVGNAAVNSPQLKAPKDQPSNHISGKSSGDQKHWKGASSRKFQPSYMILSSETVWSDVREFAKLKYQFELPEDARDQVKKVSVLRNLCQKMGITVAAYKYDLNATTPFQASDILDLLPVVKHSVPVCTEAKDLVETGKVQLAEGMLNEAYASFSEAFSILQQVTGPMHPEVANCCRYLAIVLYHAGDMSGAVIQQHKELIINERCLGLDHPDTAHSYGNMALFYHGLNQTDLALQHMSRALLLLSLSSGSDHPDVAASFINVAMMYQDMGKMDTALRYLQEALKKNERLLGKEHIQTAVCYHALAIAFNCMGNFKLSYQQEKKAYDILVKQLGEDDPRTLDSHNWMKTFKMRELQMTAEKQKGQALNVASAQQAIDILKAHPDLIHAFQAAAAAGGSGSSISSVNKSLNAALMGEALPRGRGVDERAARAAVEARKKAAARGLLIRPHGVPVQALPPLTQLLNIINSGTTPDAAAANGVANGVKGAESKPSNGSGGAKKENQPSSQEEQAPVGLGKGLASLDTKKQKAKAKVAA